jgi:hypothetical protein
MPRTPNSTAFSIIWMILRYPDKIAMVMSVIARLLHPFSHYDPASAGKALQL